MIPGLKISLTIITVLSSLIVGVLLARWTREELKPGRKYLKIAFFASLLATVVLFDLAAFKVLSMNFSLILALTAFYMAVISGISLRKARI